MGAQRDKKYSGMDSETDKQGTGRDRVQRQTEKQTGGVHEWTDRWKHWGSQGTGWTERAGTRVDQQTEVALRWVRVH